jgi:hypothetical protein
MFPQAMFRLLALMSSAVVASLLSAYGIPTVSSDYSQKSVTDLIDDLTQIDSESLGIDTFAVYEGFIATDALPSFQEGLLGVAPPPK